MKTNIQFTNLAVKGIFYVYNKDKIPQVGYQDGKDIKWGHKNNFLVDLWKKVTHWEQDKTFVLVKEKIYVCIGIREVRKQNASRKNAEQSMLSLQVFNLGKLRVHLFNCELLL